MALKTRKFLDFGKKKKVLQQGFFCVGVGGGVFYCLVHVHVSTVTASNMYIVAIQCTLENVGRITTLSYCIEEYFSIDYKGFQLQHNLFLIISSPQDKQAEYIRQYQIRQCNQCRHWLHMLYRRFTPTIITNNPKEWTNDQNRQPTLAR